MIPQVIGIQRQVLERLRSDLEAVEPEREECGLLLADGALLVERRRWPAPLPNRFVLEEGWLLQEMMRARSIGLRVGAFYHSHPPSLGLRPSRQDRAGHPPGAKVLIVGHLAGEFTWASYEVAAWRSGSETVWRSWSLTCVPD